MGYDSWVHGRAVEELMRILKEWQAEEGFVRPYEVAMDAAHYLCADECSEDVWFHLLKGRLELMASGHPMGSDNVDAAWCDERIAALEGVKRDFEELRERAIARERALVDG
jgi:hypothetical protein